MNLVFRLSSLLVGTLALAVAFSAALPALNIRSPFGYDPFNYLHLTSLQPAFQWWVDYQGAQAMPSSLHSVDVQRAMGAYSDAVTQLDAVPEFIGEGIEGLPDPTRPKCIGLQFSTRTSVTGSIASIEFDSHNRDTCSYYPASAAQSDDKSQLAIEVRPYDDDFRSALWIYSVNSSGKAQLAHKLEYAELVAPHSYLADGRVVYRPKLGQLGQDMAAKCALATAFDGKAACLIAESTLSDGKRIDALYRPAGSASMGFLLSTRARSEIDAYFFKPGDPIQFSTPSAADVGHFAVLKRGFLFSRSEPAETRYHSVTRFYLQPGASSSPTKVLEIAPYKSSFSQTKGSAFVVSREADGKKFTLTRITDTGAKEIVFKNDIERVTLVQVNESRHSGVPNVLLRTSDRKVYRGQIDSSDVFRVESTLVPGTPMTEYAFAAKSADGTTVPCDFLAPKAAKLPIPAVAVVYGSYGSSLSIGVSPLISAILVTQTGFLFAHARGGGEMGKEWHEGGRGPFKKTKTIDDFEACLEAAANGGYLIRGRVLAQGTSAGAIPAVITALRRPDMLMGAWADVPYLDSSGRVQNSWRDEMEFGSYSITEEAVARKQLSPYDNLLIHSDKSGHFLFTCGEYDRLILPWQCMKGHAAIRAFHPNKQSRFAVLKDRQHLTDHNMSPENQRNIQIIVSFILDTLKPAPVQ